MMSSIGDQNVPDTSARATNIQRDGESDVTNARKSITDVIANTVNQPSTTNVMVWNDGLSDDPIIERIPVNTATNAPLMTYSAHVMTDSLLEEQLSHSSLYRLPNEHQGAAAVVTNDSATKTSFILPEIPSLMESGLDAQLGED